MKGHKKLIVIILIGTVLCLGYGIFHIYYDRQVSPKTMEKKSKEKTTSSKAKNEPITSDEPDNYSIDKLQNQLQTFVQLYYNPAYAKHSPKNIEDYVTPRLLNTIQSNRKEKDKGETYEDPDYAIHLSELTFYVPLEKITETTDTLRVLTSFESSIRSNGSPEVNRPILVELTAIYTDCWRVDHVEDKSQLTDGGN
ncbi:hypothetical protein [Listeria goaensis]|uniref:hypothetical protein n=1 Tax=Listeria goaensis TaxID=1649188 RepID=UPI000B588E89|nr:hypothetical protein [Listeria goaensis]